MNRLVLCISAALLSVTLAKLAADEASSSPVQTPIAVTDDTSLQAVSGKTAIVSGKVDRIEVMEKSSHRRVRFVGTKFFLFINSKDFFAHPGWELDAWVGQDIFAVGLVKPYYKQLEMVVSAPEQMAATAEALKLPAGGAGSRNAAPTAPTGMPIKLPVVSLTQLRLETKGEKEKRTVEFLIEALEGRWEKSTGKSSSSGILRLETTSTRAREPAVQAAQIAAQRLGGEWPGGSVFRIGKRAAGGGGAAVPTGFATVLLLETSLRGWALPPNLHIAGDVFPNGSLEGGNNELFHLLHREPTGKPVILVPETAIDTLNDLVLEGQAARLLSVEVLSVKDLEGAAATLEAWSKQPLEVAFCDQLQQALAARGIGVLRQPEVRAKLSAVVKRSPRLNLRVLLELTNGKPPERFSVNGSAQRLSSFHRRIEQKLSTLKSDEPEAKKLCREMRDELLKLVPRCHEKSKEFAASLLQALEALKEGARYEAKDDSPRAKKARSAMQDALSKAAGDARAVQTEIGYR